QHLTSTLQVSFEFWEGQSVDLNLGDLSLTPEELSQVLSIMSERGVKPRHVFSRSDTTRASLEAHNIAPAAGSPASLQSDGTVIGGTVVRDTTVGASDKISTIDTTSNEANTEHSSGAEASAMSGAGSAPCATGNSVGALSGTECGTTDASAGSNADLPNGQPVSGDTANGGAKATAEQKAPSGTPAVPQTPHVLYLRQTL